MAVCGHDGRTPSYLTRFEGYVCIIGKACTLHLVTIGLPSLLANQIVPGAVVRYKVNMHMYMHVQYGSSPMFRLLDRHHNDVKGKTKLTVGTQCSHHQMFVMPAC